MHMKAKSKSSSTPKHKPAAPRKPARKSVPQLVVTDYDWGALYEGTKDAFIRSGLVTAQEFPKSTKARVLDNYTTYFDDGDSIRGVEWSYEDDGGWRAWVKYGIQEIAPSKIIKLAQKAVS